MADHTSLHSCVVIGAGISGLVAARTLKNAGIDTIILEKSQGMGGRMATRRIDTAHFDHGAQYFTVRDDRFERIVDDWLKAGVARVWSEGFPKDGERREPDGRPRYCGDDGMTTIPKFLAIPLDVRLNTRVTTITPGDERWRIRTDHEEEFEAEAVILTAPVPQALELLHAGGTELPTAASSQLRYVNYDPCFTVLLLFDAPSNIPEPGGMYFSDLAINWIADNHTKGISPEGYGVTIQTTTGFTRSHWDASDEQIIDIVTAQADPWLPDKPNEWQVVRWRYSQPIVAHPKQFLMIDDPAPLVFAGDGFGLTRIEGAALSGRAAARALLTRLA